MSRIRQVFDFERYTHKNFVKTTRCITFAILIKYYFKTLFNIPSGY